MSKLFFYRIDAASFFTETLKYKSDKELGKFIRQFATDLVTCSGATDYSKSVIAEATEYIRKKKEAGSKGGKQKSSSAKASLKHCPSTALASSSNSSNSITDIPTKEIIAKEGILFHSEVEGWINTATGEVVETPFG